MRIRDRHSSAGPPTPRIGTALLLAALALGGVPAAVGGAPAAGQPAFGKALSGSGEGAALHEAATAHRPTASALDLDLARDPLHTIDGCSGGRILAPRVPIYDAHPEREPARRIGWLRGTHRRDLCRGTVVIVRDRVRVSGRVWVLVEPIDGPGPGWVHDGFLGGPFPRWKCDWRFEGEALRRCLEA